MKAKTLGRLELLAWINLITISEYQKIENLSDGVAFCQTIDIYFPKALDLNRVKCKYYFLIKIKIVNSENIEDWERNILLLNDAFKYLKHPKSVDYQSLAKGKFKENFEFLQYIYDFILKGFPSDISNPKVNAYERRLDVLRNHNKAFNLDNIKKYLPSHLIPNDRVKNNLINYDQKDYVTIDESSSTKTNLLLEKYKEFLSILKDDLKKSMENNMILASDVSEIEEEKNYYLDKLIVVNDYSNEKLKESIIKEASESKEKIEEVIKLLTYIPEDFK